MSAERYFVDGRLERNRDLGVAVYPPVEHLDDAASVGRERRVVCHHDDSVAAFMQFGQLFHDDVARFGIEVAGRFVGKNDRRVVDEGAGNGDALRLAAGQLPGHIVFALAEMERFEYLAGHFEPLGTVDAFVGERERDVFDDIEAVDEVEALEYDADLLAADPGMTGSAEAFDGYAVEQVVTVVGAVK